MIPLAKDTRDAVGDFADRVENRSLLFEKMVLAKNWGHDVDRFNDANRFNVLRASSEGGTLLSEDQQSAQRKATSPRSKPWVKEENAYKAKVAGALAKVRVDQPGLIRRQAENGMQLLSLLERSYGGRSLTFVGQLGGRLLINMAGGVQENAGLALDRCFGLPYLPGSAVKGVTRHAALWDIRNEKDAGERARKLRLALVAFGFIGQDIGPRGDFTWAAGGDKDAVRSARDSFTKSETFRGILSFLPAYPTTEPEIMAEVLTPHPRADLAASGKGDPRPLFFPAVREGSSFGFALLTTWLPEGVDVAEVLQQAGGWLKSAITTNGIGAKTGAGYGWFVIDPAAEEKRRAEMAAIERRAQEQAEAEALAAAEKQAEADRLAAMSPEQKAAESVAQLNQEQFAEFAKNLADKDEVEQRAFFTVLLSKEHKETRKRWQKKKEDLWASLSEVAGKLNISLS